MGKLLYSAAMSLDGFIAGPGGDMGWLAPYTGDASADELAAEVGALLVGRRTFSGDDPYRGTENEGKAFGGLWDGPQIVLTRGVAPAVPGVTFCASLEEGVAAARAAAGEKTVNVLGASVGRACVEAGLLDEVEVMVMPVLLGGGVRLFERPGPPVPLELLAQRGTSLRYRVLR
ncbi:deaminase [Amycolatopsis sp. AA4]|uniref:dihydrofolate reductase family protein n=1 Tax=Actinomycetes TaxID=1760 RepID=UPI0001B54022|nr:MULTISPECIES: dihydrofolate reductase family protein [Actinomycetes]ATY16482.1 deaminase [Amycolatopsis sp. AA4]